MKRRPTRSRLDFSQLDPELIRELSNEIETWRNERIDTKYLNKIGKLWTDDALPVDTVHSESLSANVDAIEKILTRSQPTSVLVVGNAGVGKSVLIKVLGRRMLDRGWHVFEATAANVIAGQRYVGDIEERIHEIVERLATSRRILWYVPNFHELHFSGGASRVQPSRCPRLAVATHRTRCNYGYRRMH